MRFTRRIAADHPSLAGHFPGRPIVPGVVLLCEVERAVTGEFAARVTGWPNVKFTSPLLPERDFVITLEKSEARLLRFTIVSEKKTIATGAVELERG
ncbi:MAG: hypothetical protein ACREV9_00745 [Burkholderiales bacterium]